MNPSTRLRNARLLPLIGLFISLTLSHDALAGGFSFPDNTTKSVGRGGAYMLGAVGPEAIYLNPALLTRLDGFQTTLNLNVNRLDLNFHRAGIDPNTVTDDSDGSRYGIESNDAGPFPAPMLFLSNNFGLENFGFGLGVFGPSSYGTRTFPETGAQRYVLVKSELLEVLPSAAIAYQIDGLRLGATFQLAMLYTNLDIVISSTISNATKESPDDDTLANIQDLQDIKPTGILGVAYDLSPALSFGLSYKLPVDFNADGKLKLTFPDSVLIDAAKPRLTDDSATLIVHDAAVIRAAGRYAHIDAGKELFDIELMITYERWSQTKDITVETAGQVELFGAPIDIEDISLPKNWDDTISVRLGSDVALNKTLTLRGGMFYETATVPNNTTHIDFAAWERIGAGLGITAHLSDFDFDLGYMFIHQPDRTVTDGQVKIQAPLFNGEKQVVNNGDWSSHIQTLSVGITYRFDQPKDATTPAITDL